MKKIVTKTKVPKREISGKLFVRVFLPWTAILILSHLLTMYIAPTYMWGVHFYHFFPDWIGWILTLVTLTILIPGVAEYLYEKFEALAKKIKKPFVGWGENKTFLILSFLSLPIFWIFRTRFHLLGDGYFRIIDLPKGKLHLQEWLDGFIHLVIYRVMTKLIPTWTPELTYSIISILCGGVFVFLALKLSSLLGKTDLGKVLVFFFLISLGSIELFFGYVESYSILQVVLLAYIYFAALYLSGKTSILPALLFFVISIGLHITSLIFAPAFIYLLWVGGSGIRADKISTPGIKDATAPPESARKRKVRLRKESSKARRKLSTPTLMGLIISSIIILFWVYGVATSLEKTGKGIFILPLKAPASYPFGMFSLAHISEFVNQLLLLSPLGISLLIFFLFFRIKFKDRLIIFLIFASFFALIYLFVVNFTLGSADWDLRSAPAPFFGLLGVLLFLRWGEKQSTVHSPQSTDPHPKVSAGKRVKAWGLVFIWFSLFHTIPWVLVNAHHQRSVERYLLIQGNDPHPVDETGYNTFKIARILKFAGLEQEVDELYKNAIQKDPQNPLNYYNLASRYYDRGKLDDAIPYLESSLNVAPHYVRPNWLLGKIYQIKGDLDKALFYLEHALPWLKNNVGFLYDLGSISLLKGKLDQAEKCALRILELVPNDTKAYHLLGSIYMEKKNYEKAKKVWENILMFSPEDSVAIQNLRQLEEQMKE
ncbi:MAG: hypothetical protein AMJ91_02285 [candidate division Zixibacteria bacterium SM23_73_3]|nr:MAG: hypothetical protein AMJ91_02285 [candidate division Zixibacteria bacterium SM23_73_3]